MNSWVSNQRSDYQLPKNGKNSSSPDSAGIDRAAPSANAEVEKRPHEYEREQDWSIRSKALIDVTASSAKKPKSKMDLSAAALAFTAPGGEMGVIERGSKLEGGISNELLKDFLEAGRKLESPTTEELRSLLPHSCWLNDDQIRHLFRNFCDAKEITGEEKLGRVNISRREMDIINYFIVEQKDFRDCCFLLMPYRDGVSVSKLYKFLKKKRFTKTIPGYREHIMDKIGTMLQLESVEDGNDGDGDKKRNRDQHQQRGRKWH